MPETTHSRFHRIKKWLLPIAVLLLAVAIVAVLRATSPAAPSRPIQEKVWNVKVIPATFETRQPQLTLYGRIESPRSSTLSSSVTAYVAKLNTAEGKRVKKGDILIRLDARDAQLLLDQREADRARIEAMIETERVRFQADQKALVIERELVAISQSTVARFQNLKKRQVASQTQLDDARRTQQQQALSLNTREQAIADHPNRLAQLKAQLQQATALRDTATLDLERTEIKAPFDSRIAKINIAPGYRVSTGDTLLTLYNDQNLEVRAQIPNRFLARIRGELDRSGSMLAIGQLEGQPITLQLDRIAGRVLGKVGVDALFLINSNETPLEPGRVIALNLKLPPVEQVLSLPPQAIYGTDRVYRVVDNRLEAHQINRLGDAVDSDGNPLILVTSSTLKPDDSVVATQLPNAISGLRVKVSE
ncbi:MAG: biotin/lipoyl-binding protein [Amphritea sp.]